MGHLVAENGLILVITPKNTGRIFDHMYVTEKLFKHLGVTEKKQDKPSLTTLYLYMCMFVSLQTDRITGHHYPSGFQWDHASTRISQ